MTHVVSGATVIDIPSPTSRDEGKIVRQYLPPKLKNGGKYKKPSATMAGPTTRKLSRRNV